MQFARAVVPRGTTTVVTDPHEIANVLGLEGIRFMFESAKFGPLNMYVMASSCVPATSMATSGAVLHGYDLFPLKSDPWHFEHSLMLKNVDAPGEGSKPQVSRCSVTTTE